VALHDLARDPEELHDLAAEHPTEAAELAERLRGTGPGDAADPSPPQDVPDGDVRRALESLGYLQ
jgi:hypothetical protein